MASGKRIMCNLTICIPTFNRAILINEALDNIMPIAKAYNVQVIVSDNASQDETPSITKKYCSMYENLTYIRHDKNIGPDKNFEYVLRKSHTNYTWLFGDGVRLKKESFQEILDVVSENKYDLIVVNANGRVSGIKSKKYSDENALLSDLGWHMTLINSLIYSKKIINESNFKRYYDTNFLQTGVIFEFIVNNCNVFWLNIDPIYNTKIKKANDWTDKTIYIFGYRWVSFVLSLPPCYTLENKISCIKRHSKFTKLFGLENMVRLRGRGSLRFRDILKYRKTLKIATGMPIIYFFSFILIPKILCVFMELVVKKIKFILR